MLDILSIGEIIPVILIFIILASLYRFLTACCLAKNYTYHKTFRTTKSIEQIIRIFQNKPISDSLFLSGLKEITQFDDPDIQIKLVARPAKNWLYFEIKTMDELPFNHNIGYIKHSVSVTGNKVRLYLAVDVKLSAFSFPLRWLGRRVDKVAKQQNLSSARQLFDYVEELLN